jgi:hypothetical protein
MFELIGNKIKNMSIVCAMLVGIGILYILFNPGDGSSTGIHIGFSFDVAFYFYFGILFPPCIFGRDLDGAFKAGFLFRAPGKIKLENPDVRALEEYDEFYDAIKEAIQK